MLPLTSTIPTHFSLSTLYLSLCVQCTLCKYVCIVDWYFHFQFNIKINASHLLCTLTDACTMHTSLAHPTRCIEPKRHHLLRFHFRNRLINYQMPTNGINNVCHIYICYDAMQCNAKAMLCDAMGITFFHFVCHSQRNWNGTFRLCTVIPQRPTTQAQLIRTLCTDKSHREERSRKRKNEPRKSFPFPGQIFEMVFFLVQTNIFLFMFGEQSEKRRILPDLLHMLLRIL